LGDSIKNIPSAISNAPAYIGNGVVNFGKSVQEFGRTAPEKAQVFSQDSAQSLKEIFVESPQVIGKASWEGILSFGKGIKNLAEDIKLAFLGRKVAVEGTPSTSSGNIPRAEQSGVEGQSSEKPSSAQSPQTIVVKEKYAPFSIPSVFGSTTIDGSLTLNGNALFKGSEVKIAAPLFLENNFTINSVFSIDAASGNLVSSGDITASGKLSGKDLTANGMVNFSGATVDFTGAKVIGLATSGGTISNNYYYSSSGGGSGGSVGGQFDSLSINGDGAIKGALTVTGAANFNSNVTIGDASSDTLTINASVISIPNGVTFSNGAVSFGSGATATSTFGGNITVNGDGTSTLLYGATVATLGGALGVGTSSPVAKLGVAGNAYISGNTTIGNSTTLFVDAVNNRVGISTSSPQAKLHVVGTSDGRQIIVQANSTQTSNVFEYQNAAGSSPLAWINPSGNIGTSGTIYASGNGTSTFSGNVDIAGTLAGGGGLLTLAKIGTPTYSNIQQMQDLFHSAGWISGGTMASGTSAISVAAGTGFIRSANDATAKLYFFDWSASSTVVVPVNTSRYIGVEYNAGSPRITIRTLVDWDYKTDFPLGRITNEDGVIHIENDTQAVGDNAANVIRREYETLPLQRDERTGGLELGETGTRNVTVSEGALWDRLNRYPISDITTAGSDTFDVYYRSAVSGSFIKIAASTTWQNTQYDNGSGTLQPLTVGNYGVNWFYIETDGDLVMVYGRQNNASLAAAEAEGTPATVPDRLTASGKLIGRIIFQKGAATAAEISSVFSTTFAPTLTSSHSNLSNLDYNSSGHTGFVGSNGVAGGQTIIGGTAATDFLALQSTSAAGTTDYIKFLVGSSGGTEAMRILHNGSIGIGTTAPAQALDVAGTVQMTGFKLTTNPVAGYILSSDANGVGSWADVSSIAGPWTLAANNLYPDSTSYNVAVGDTDAGSAKLYVNGNVGIGNAAPG